MVSLKHSLVLLFLWYGACLLANTIRVQSDTVCQGMATTLHVEVEMPVENLRHYLWDLDNDGVFEDTATTAAKQFTFSSAGEHMVDALAILQNGDSIKTTSKEIVKIYPHPSFSLSTMKTCEGEETRLLATVVMEEDALNTLDWDFNADGETDAQGIAASYRFASAGEKTIKLSYLTQNACTGHVGKNITIHPKPTANFDVDPVCRGDSSRFVITSEDEGGEGLSFLWKFGDAGQEMFPGNVSHLYSSPGDYQSRLIVISAMNCQDTMIKQASVYPVPSLVLDFDQDTALLYQGQEVTITASTDQGSVTWNPGGTSPFITVNESGTYSAVATNSQGCTDAVSMKLAFKPWTGIKLKSKILTPNNDGVNDFLVIRDIQAFKSVKIWVYNQFGQQVYRSEQYQNDWDGQYKGKTLDKGTYFFFIQTDKGEASGSINLLN